MRTTIDLPDALFREMKIRAARQGVKLKDLVTEYIETGLRGQSTSVATQPRQRAPLPSAIPREPGKPLIPARTNRELAAILERDDLANHQRALQPPPGMP